jgi:hypothetical protein
MTEDRVEFLLRRASELDDMVEASEDNDARHYYRTLAESYRKMAAQEIRIQEAMAGKK